MSFIALCVAAIGIWSMFGVFWAVPADFLGGVAAAGGFALINSIGTLGGFAGPSLVGFVHDRTGTFSASLLVLSGLVLVAAFLAATLRLPSKAPVAASLSVDQRRAAEPVVR